MRWATQQGAKCVGGIALARDAAGAPRLTLPTGLYRAETCLLLDDEIHKLGSATGRQVRLASHRWLSVNLAVQFGRRALEKAYGEAFYATQRRSVGDWHNDWSRGAELAEAARSSLRRLLLHLSPQDRPPIDPEALAMLLVPKTSGEGDTVDPMAGVAKARQQAATLVDAMQILDTLPVFMEAGKDRVAPLRRNPGEPEKDAFLYSLGEAWFALTDRVPGASPNTEQNPFLRFVEAAWQDVGGSEDDNFAQALRSALRGNDDPSALRRPLGRPDWLRVTDPA